MTTVPQYYRHFLLEYRKALRNTLSFHLAFGALLTGEILSLLLFFPALSHSTFFALGVGALFLTCFTYFVLLFYFQANKPSQYRALKDRLVESCRPHVSEGHSHLAIAHSLLELASYLEAEEAPVPSFLSQISTKIMQRDLLRMKLLLVEGAIEEHLLEVRQSPLDLEVHMSLGSAYILLSKLLKERSAKASQEASRLAMQEFLILNQIAPHDPWVHEQLADSYRELGQHDDELRQIEQLRELKPKDADLMLRHGRLSFERGQVAQALKIYDQLRSDQPAHAEALMSYYGRNQKPFSEEL